MKRYKLLWAFFNCSWVSLFYIVNLFILIIMSKKIIIDITTEEDIKALLEITNDIHSRTKKYFTICGLNWFSIYRSWSGFIINIELNIDFKMKELSWIQKNNWQEFSIQWITSVLSSIIKDITDYKNKFIINY